MKASNLSTIPLTNFVYQDLKYPEQSVTAEFLFF